jgi:hypothetical protein
MKNFILILTLLILTTSRGVSQSGTVKLWSEFTSFRYENEYGTWTEWSDWERNRVLLVFDFDNTKIKIYSKEYQEFDLIEELEAKERDQDEGGNWYTKVKSLAIDNDGRRCHIDVLKYDDKEKRAIYIRWSDFQFVYLISDN